MPRTLVSSARPRAMLICALLVQEYGIMSAMGRRPASAPSDRQCVGGGGEEGALSETAKTAILVALETEKPTRDQPEDTIMTRPSFTSSMDLR